jgi:PAS domain S-box-containing protein
MDSPLGSRVSSESHGGASIAGELWPGSVDKAVATLGELASIFHPSSSQGDPLAAALSILEAANQLILKEKSLGVASEDRQPSLEARYRALVEQIPAVVFMAYFDRGVGEAYVSPQIEASLGFTQQEWLEDPVRWYRQIHPDDKQRWSSEAATMFLTGNPLRSAYRVVSRDGRVIWFHCEAKMVRREDGRPWFIHGAAFDITDLKQAEECLKEERNVASAILDTVGALVVVLDPLGRIVRFNRACERATGCSLAEVEGKHLWDLFMALEDSERFRTIFERLKQGELPDDYESYWVNREGGRRLIAWSSTLLRAEDGAVTHIIATGIDVTERKRLSDAVLEVGASEQRRIGQDLHDGLGQHLTGIAFMSKALEQKLADQSLPESRDAAKIVRLVNEAIDSTRKLARGLLPVVSEAEGLMSALQQWADEVEDRFGISCWFQCIEPVLMHDGVVATQLYHIAQEAVNNAIKHGGARHVVIRLGALPGTGSLTIQDDGSGIPEVFRAHQGMGLRIMGYRAKMIGGSVEIQRGPERGTVVTCLFPLRVNGEAGKTA